MLVLKHVLAHVKNVSGPGPGPRLKNLGHRTWVMNKSQQISVDHWLNLVLILSFLPLASRQSS